jgi:hypothetical protein
VTWKVEYRDEGLSTLEGDALALLRDVLDVSARAVERSMKANIIARGFVDTRATLNSVAVSAPNDMERDIGPSTEYAIYGELGYVQTHAWGRRLANPIRHPGLFFARDALESVRASFLAGCAAAMQRLGR